jgi:lysophospholipase L1-like esterase
MTTCFRFAGAVFVLAALVAPIAAAAAPSPLVVSVGDSIAYGFGLSAPSSQSYTALYARRVGGRALNLAVPGVACVDVHNEQLRKIPHDAAVVIVNCGTNDIAGFGFYASGLPNGWQRGEPATYPELQAAERGYARLIFKLKRLAPHAQIVLVNLRHWARMTGRESPLLARDTDDWNAMLTMTGLRVVDISADRRLYSSHTIQADLLHPNAAGHAAIASDF